LYFFYRGPAGYQVHADSNGCAAGNTLEEAIVQGFLELVERDAYAIWWYNRSQRAEVDLGQFDDPYIRDLKPSSPKPGAAFGCSTSPAISASDLRDDRALDGNAQEFVEFGSGAHFDARIAALRAMTELSQFLSIGLMGRRAPNPSRQESNLESNHDGAPSFRLQDHAYLMPSGTPVVRPDFGSKFGELDKREQVTACVDLVRRAGLDFLVLDQTRPDIEVRSCG
jgi:ribosomal protein S12 methylthiotransferase accessory factor